MCALFSISCARVSFEFKLIHEKKMREPFQEHALLLCKKVRTEKRDALSLSIAIIGSNKDRIDLIHPVKTAFHLCSPLHTTLMATQCNQMHSYNLRSQHSDSMSTIFHFLNPWWWWLMILQCKLACCPWRLVLFTFRFRFGFGFGFRARLEESCIGSWSK